MDSGTLTPLLKKLEAIGFIKKYRSKEDDRVVIAELTEEGESLQEKAKNIPDKILCSMNIEKEKVKRLKQELDEVLENLKL